MTTYAEVNEFGNIHVNSTVRCIYNEKHRIGRVDRIRVPETELGNLTGQYTHALLSVETPDGWKTFDTRKADQLTAE